MDKNKTNIRPEKLALLRQSKGLTVEQLAIKMKEIGTPVSADTINKWEQGAWSVTEDNLKALVTVLGCKENQLLQFKDKDTVNYDLPLGNNIKFKDNCRRQIVPVYACQSDTTHPKVLELAKGSGLITEARYKALIDNEVGVKPELLPDELALVLETYFGFKDGICEIHEIHDTQKTRMGKQLAGEYRYTGEERMDKDWLESGLASTEVKEFSKYGGVVTMEDNQGYGSMVIEDYLRDK